MKNIPPSERIELTERSAERAGCEKRHTEQVRRLSLKLFDELAGLHGLGAKERLLLEQAALLHDIAASRGKAHHKAARDIVLSSPDIPFDGEEERAIAALVVRYHKGALPAARHKCYKELDKDARTVVEKLSSIIRIADGLDRAHDSAVRDLSCSVSKGKMAVRLDAEGFSGVDDSAAREKADLFEKVFGLEVEFDWGK